MEEKDLINFELPVTVYGNLEKYNDVISKGRCRIFYKGANRNGTFITDEFADKLLSTIAYAPVKGIYDTEDGDYTDHGEKRSEGRIYGIVPKDYNLTWEPHLDDDGIERIYATVDVFIYTALYEEANSIFSKSQSMELYRKSIKGDWRIIDSKRYYVFTDACFLGLQALGDEVEPCFEGAAFFSLYQSLLEQVEQLDKLQDNFQNNGQGGSTMPSLTFKVSDGQKFDFLWALLNPNCNEENGWAVEYVICEVYDEYAVAYNYVEGTYERVYYTKDDATDSVSIDRKERCYILDVSENEKKALDTLRVLNGSTYECVDEKFATIEGLNAKISENDTKVEELNTTISTLTVERDEANSQKAELQNQFDAVTAQYTEAQTVIDTLTGERDALAAYKKNVEDEGKKAVIAAYVSSVDSVIIDQYTADMDKYTAEELDIRLTYEQKKAHPELFVQTPKPAYVPKDEDTKGGLEEILAKYERKK